MTRQRIRHLLGRFRRADGGMAAVEFALMAPLLSALLISGYDVSRFVRARSAVDKVGFSVADVTSQYKDLTAQSMKEIFTVTASSLTDFVSGTNGVTILTSVVLNTSNVPTVKWQCFSSTGTSWASKVGASGAKATVDTGLLADQNDNLIIAEVYYRYTPTFTKFFTGPFDVYSKQMFRPRLGSLTTKPC